MDTESRISEKVLAYIVKHFANGNHEEGYSDLTTADVAKALGLSPKAAGGAVTTLQNAGKIEVEEWDTGCRKVQYFIHLI